MFCIRCGTENDKNNKYCSSCGSELSGNTNVTNSVDNENPILKKAKTISIVGIILSFIFPLSIIGFILSIIGLVFNGKYRKETGRNGNYFPLNIIGLIISTVQIIVILFVILFTVLLVTGTNDTYVGKWNCGTSSYSSNYYVTAEFKENGKFSWGKYGDVLNNNYLGNYTEYKRSTSDLSRQYYDLTLNIEDYTLNGEVQEDKSRIHETLDADIYVYDESDRAVITITTTNKVYYCKRVD